MIETTMMTMIIMHINNVIQPKKTSKTIIPTITTEEQQKRNDKKVWLVFFLEGKPICDAMESINVE